VYISGATIILLLLVCATLQINVKIDEKFGEDTSMKIGIVIGVILIIIDSIIYWVNG
jgi:hypothetical protein